MRQDLENDFIVYDTLLEYIMHDQVRLEIHQSFVSSKSNRKIYEENFMVP